jgi:hypothetical protein
MSTLKIPKDYLRIYLLATPCLIIGFLSDLGIHNLYASGFGLLCFCTLLVVLINRKTHFLILLPTCFSFIWLCISVLYLETGAYAPEIAEQTTANGSTGRLISLLTIFLLTIFFFLPSKKEIKILDNRRLEVTIILFYWLLIIALVANGVVYGFPILSFEQRFYYWDNNPLGSVLSKALAFSGYLFLFVGWRIGRDEKLRFSYLIKVSHWKLIILIFIFIGLLYSNKASYFLSVILYLVAGYLISKSSLTDKFELFSQLPIKYFVLATTLVFSVALLSYHYVHGYIGEELTNQLLRRVFAMQGQIWWGIDSVGPVQFSNFTEMLIKDENDGPYGIYLMMQKIMPTSAFNFYFDNKIPLTGGFPASLIFYFPYSLTAIFVIAFGVLSGMIFSGSIKALTNGRHEFLIWVIMLSSLSWLTSLGSLNVITSPIFIAASSLLLSLELIRRLHHSQRPKTISSFK